MRAKTDNSGNRITNVAQVYQGTEPKWGVSDMSLSDRIGDAINWYSATFDNSDFKSWTLTYFKKNGFSTNFNDDVVEPDFRSIGMLIRMKEKGCNFDDEWAAKFESLIKKLRARTKSEKKEPVIEKSRYDKIQETMEKRRRNSIALIEELCDDIFRGKVVVTAQTTWEMLKINIPSNYMKDLSDVLDLHLEDLEDALDAFDAKKPDADQLQLREGYSNFSRAKLAKYIDSLQHLQNLCDGVAEKAIQQKVVNRKPKEKKPINIDKLVEFCSYQKEMTDPKFTSIHPKKVIGADQVIIYNTEKRIVTIFKASSDNGLSIKGTTIIGFDEKNSIRKTVRKPEIFLPSIIKASKPAAKNLIKDLVAKPQEASGRMNSETVILKVD